MILRTLFLSIERYRLRWRRDHIHPLYPDLGELIIRLQELDDELDKHKRTASRVPRVSKEVRADVAGGEAGDDYTLAEGFGRQPSCGRV